ncbi:MAG: NADH oxidase [Rhodanobacteraceae bacterium]|jgi:putative peptide maturation dehydrogenase|nr:MAG: NADH oxidase [Rhodanobacteraceae bacterium]
MPTSRVRRCAQLQFRLEQSKTLDFAALLSGRPAVSVRNVRQALAAHLDQPVEIDAAAMQALAGLDCETWAARDVLAAAHGAACIEGLLARQLLLAEDDDSPAARRDRDLRASHWHGGAAIAHAMSRWSHNDSIAAQRESRLQSVDDMVEAFGAPPPHFHRREDAIARVVLDEPARTPLDDLLERRATCRNFDLAQSVSAAQLSALLKRVFGVQGKEELAPGAVALKKNHPSGGGLHPVEAYLLVQRMEGLVPGLYHYNAEAHALDLLRELSPGEARAFAMTAVAGQEYFADAPVMVVMATRFARSMWKYRNHPKIYRAILLEMGHISQNLYLTATEMNLGAFITAAINEVEIEQAFGLEPLAEGPLCVCGFGARAKERVTVEFDPGHKVWGDA